MSTVVSNVRTTEGVSSISWQEWTLRLQAYISWVNSQLKKHPGSRKIKDLRYDIQDGVVIAQLIKVLGGECVSGINSCPTTPASCKENVERVFQFLSFKKVPIFQVGAKDVSDGDLKKIMRLIHAVASHYRPDSVLNPPGGCRSATSLGHNVDIELGRKMTSNAKSATSNVKPTTTSLGRQRSSTTSLAVRKVIGGSSLPIRRQPLSTRDSPRLSQSPSSTSLDREKNLLKKSVSSLNAERLAKGGGEVDGASSNGSPTPREITPKASCKVAPLQYSQSHLFNSKLTRKKLLVSKSEPCSLDTVDLRIPNKEILEKDKKNSCSCSELYNDVIDQLIKDIKEAKQQLLMLQDLLLHGSGGKLTKKLEQPISYGSTDELETALPHTLVQDTNQPDIMNSKRTKASEPLSMVKKLINYMSVCSERKDIEFEESTKLKSSGCDPPTSCKRNLKDENETLRKTIDEKNQEINRLKVALTSQVNNYDKKISKYPYSATTRTQREELQVVHEALMSLRKCFPVNDPYQHTLDTIEQSLSALLERVNSLEMATVPTQSTPTLPDTDALPGLVRRLNLEHTNDARRNPLPKISGFSIQRLEDNRIRLENSTKVVYYMDKSVTPFRCLLHKRIGEATLRDFKLLFDRPGQYRYHFKTLDPEFGMVKEEVLHDDDILPGWDGKIIAWIEEDCS